MRSAVLAIRFTEFLMYLVHKGRRQKMLLRHIVPIGLESSEDDLSDLMIDSSFMPSGTIGSIDTGKGTHRNFYYCLFQTMTKSRFNEKNHLRMTWAQKINRKQLKTTKMFVKCIEQKKYEETHFF